MITAAQQKLMNSSYVNNQLSRIDITATQSLKITDTNGNKTNFIGINDRDTISILIHYLLKRREAIL